jgi:putative molybdopterin biosynthesis protein
MSREMMSTREVAHYLNLNEKKVYALIRKRELPGTKITGKWVFPRKLVDRWIEEDAGPGHAPEEAHTLLLVGSHDLATEVFASSFSSVYPDMLVCAANVGSVGGLVALREGRCHVAGTHLFHPATKAYNLPYIRKYLPGVDTVVVHFVDRDQGLMVQAGNPLDITGFPDLARPGVRFINRQPGAGTRVLLDHHLQRLGIESHRIDGYDTEVSTHTQVAASVRSAHAHAGLGIRSAALAFGLDFVPVAREAFDLVIRRDLFYTEPIQKLVDLLRSDDFASKVDHLGGYDLSDTGGIRTWK